MAKTKDVGTAFICQGCGNKSVGIRYTFQGKIYCYECYQKIMRRQEKQVSEKEHLYSYIKSLFSVYEIPVEVLNFIEKELNNGKKPKGMESTLKYYYEILGNSLVLNGVGYVLKDQYENAKKYFEETKKIQENNKKVEFDKIPPRVVYINPADLESETRNNRPKYKIEDL